LKTKLLIFRKQHLSKFVWEGSVEDQSRKGDEGHQYGSRSCDERKISKATDECRLQTTETKEPRAEEGEQTPPVW
jgi:hypothetical protein